MLTINLNKKDGLTNGVCGYVSINEYVSTISTTKITETDDIETIDYKNTDSSITGEVMGISLKKSLACISCQTISHL